MRDLLTEEFWTQEAERHRANKEAKEYLKKCLENAAQMRARSGREYERIVIQRRRRPDMGDRVTIPNARFQPWVPQGYFVGLERRKTLVVAESGYQGDQFDPTYRDPDEPNFLRCVVIECAFQERYRVALFTKLRRALAGKNASVETYNNVAYHWFVQDWIERARYRPSEQQWQAGCSVFQDVVHSLGPDIILVFGKQTWGHLPEPDRERVLADGIVGRDYGTAIAAHIPHPSSGAFRYSDAWRAVASLRQC